MNLAQRLVRLTDAVLTVSIAALLLGTALGFGGGVWWSSVWMAVGSGIVVTGVVARMLLQGSPRLLKSPLGPLGLLALGLGLVQLVPLPSGIAARVSPQARGVYSQGVIPRLARADDSEPGLPEPLGVRSPMSLDRPSTARWCLGAAACLGLFWGVAHFADRFRRLALVWGMIVAAFFVNTGFALVQVGCQTGGLFGLYQPGLGPFWAPGEDDLLTTPNRYVLRTTADKTSDDPARKTAWAVLVPDRPFLFGSMMGGPGAYLALGSLALPLAVGLLLHLLAPRGSREPLGARLAQSGQGSLVWLLGGMSAAAALVVGVVGGPLASTPMSIALLVVGIGAAWPTGLRWASVGVTAVLLLMLGVGVALGDLWSRLPDAESRPPFASPTIQSSAPVWKDAVAILADFPLTGAGMGSFATVAALLQES